MKSYFNLKDITKDIFYYSGIIRFLLCLLRSGRYPKLLILTYHRVTPAFNGQTYMGLPVEIFEKHMKFIKNNFKLVSTVTGLKMLNEDDRKGIYIAVHLDDGYMDNYVYAYPILKKYEIPATVFLATDFIGKNQVFWWDRTFDLVESSKFNKINIDIDSKNLCFRLDGPLEIKKTADYINSILATKEEEQIERLLGKIEKRFKEKAAKPSPMLGWDEIKEMSMNEISFGAHTVRHSNLCLLMDSEIRKELLDSKKAIEQRLNKEVSEFAYPFGIFNNRVKELVKEAGFKCARATSKGINFRKSDKFLLASVNAGSILKTSFLASRIYFSSQYRKV